MPTFDAAACAEIMDALTAISARAAVAIRSIGEERGIRTKTDGSPVTKADEAAEAEIRDSLRRLAPVLPIISEEQSERDPRTVEAPNYFLVDPLDGTREFIAGRDEYTINIALMADRVPILGVITAPALGTIWRGTVGHGAERITLAAGGKTSQPHAIHTRPRPQNELVVVVSRSHLEARTQAYVRSLADVKVLKSGSSIKFCRLAEGSADLYPRLAPTRDWDIAAGEAIVRAAGGGVSAPDGTPLRYGTSELLIPAFLAWGEPKGGSAR